MAIISNEFINICHNQHIKTRISYFNTLIQDVAGDITLIMELMSVYHAQLELTMIKKMLKHAFLAQKDR